MTQAIEIRVGCEFHATAPVDTPAIFQVVPRSEKRHRIVKQDWSSTPPIGIHDYTDVYDNLCRRLTLPEGPSTVRYDALVHIPPTADTVDLDARESPAAHTHRGASSALGINRPPDPLFRPPRVWARAPREPACRSWACGSRW